MFVLFYSVLLSLKLYLHDLDLSYNDLDHCLRYESDSLKFREVLKPTTSALHMSMTKTDCSENITFNLCYFKLSIYRISCLK